MKYLMGDLKVLSSIYIYIIYITYMHIYTYISSSHIYLEPNLQVRRNVTVFGARSGGYYAHIIGKEAEARSHCMNVIKNAQLATVRT